MAALLVLGNRGISNPVYLISIRYGATLRCRAGYKLDSATRF